MDRVQRTRAKGSKLPPNTLCVTRGTLFGNGYKIIHNNAESRQTVVNRFRSHINNPLFGWKVKAFIERCEREGIEHLACWCKPDEICHADVWLEIWNNSQLPFTDSTPATSEDDTAAYHGQERAV